MSNLHPQLDPNIIKVVEQHKETTNDDDTTITTTTKPPSSVSLSSSSSSSSFSLVSIPTRDEYFLFADKRIAVRAWFFLFRENILYYRALRGRGGTLALDNNDPIAFRR